MMRTWTEKNTATQVVNAGRHIHLMTAFVSAFVHDLEFHKNLNAPDFNQSYNP